MNRDEYTHDKNVVFPQPASPRINSVTVALSSIAQSRVSSYR